VSYGSHLITPYVSDPGNWNQFLFGISSFYTGNPLLVTPIQAVTGATASTFDPYVAAVATLYVCPVGYPTITGLNLDLSQSKLCILRAVAMLHSTEHLRQRVITMPPPRPSL
jgi:hypothetical protein